MWLTAFQKYSNYVQNEWHHVRSEYNPSNLVSSCQSPCELINNSFWFNGPTFLSKPYSHWPKLEIPFDTSDNIDTDLGKRKSVAMPIVNETEFEIFQKYSSFNKLLRVVAYCYRFCLNANKGGNKHSGFLHPDELSRSHNAIMKIIQNQAFPDELRDLGAGKTINKNSRLKALDAFIDQEGIIRVGGSIRYANISYDKKFPIVLPSNHDVTKLIIRQEHLKQLHSGVEETLYSIRSRYWLLNGRNSVKNVLRSCIRCFKVRPKALSTKMADLPKCRLEPIRPFFKISLDIGGPLYLKQENRSSKKIIKGYFLVFVCLATRAYHIELISDLTTETFINSLKRFTSRRGGVSLLICDNATNFGGAENEFARLIQLLQNSETQSILKNYEVFSKILFQFAPPRSPHFNGLAEHAIKRVKNYIKKIAGNSNLTFEEMYSLLVSIEGILNSRPLTALSSDPNDLNVLSPSHFLIGESLSAPVEVDLTPCSLSLLSRWQMIEHMKQHFWKRFQKEVLSELQTRCKWREASKRSLDIGALVLLVDENAPPLRWRMGRVIATYPGKDGIIRVEEVRTVNGLMKRAITKVCPLPIDTV